MTIGNKIGAKAALTLAVLVLIACLTNRTVSTLLETNHSVAAPAAAQIAASVGQQMTGLIAE